MGTQYLGFFIAVAILVCVHATTSAAYTVEAKEANIDSIRLLRTGTAVRDEHEERYFELPTSTVEKFKSMFIPKTISDDMIKRWVNEKKSVDNVFVRLKLTTTSEEKLLKNPNFMTWLHYVEALNTKTGGPSWLAVSKLTNYYSNEFVAKLIETAKKTPGMENMASSLHSQQFQYWFDGRSCTPDFIFRSLRLSSAGKDLVEYPSNNPLFLKWIDYMKYYNGHIDTTTKQPATFLETLGGKYMYNDDEISDMVRAAKKSTSTMEFAIELKAEQAKRRIFDGMPPFEVWYSLQSGGVENNILASPEFKTFVKIVDQFNMENPDKKISVVSLLTEFYGKWGPTRLIIRALLSKDPGAKHLAKKMENALIKDWLTRYDPTEVFRTLNLHKSPGNLMKNPLLRTWIKYLDAYNAKYPDKQIAIFDVLRSQFGIKSLYRMMIKHEIATELLLKKVAADNKALANVH